MDKHSALNTILQTLASVGHRLADDRGAIFPPSDRSSN